MFDFKLVCSFVFCNPKCNQWNRLFLNSSFSAVKVISSVPKHLIPKYETSLPLPKWPMDWSRTEKDEWHFLWHFMLDLTLIHWKKNILGMYALKASFFGDHFLFKQSLRGGNQCARKLQNWCRSCNFWWKGKSLRKAMVPLTKQRAASYYVAAKRQNFIEVREEKFLRKKTEHHFIFLLKEKMHD